MHESSAMVIRRNCFLLILVFVILLLTSCKNLSFENQAEFQSNNLVSTQETVQQNGDIFVVEGWVIKSESNGGKTVIVVASLLKNGFRLGDKNVHVTWPDPSKDQGTGSCDAFSHHGTAECTIYTNHLDRGEFVPVTIRFEFEGNYYYGETGFTPE